MKKPYQLSGWTKTHPTRVTELHFSVSMLLSNLTDRPSSPQLDLVLRDRIMSAVFLSSIVEKRKMESLGVLR